VKPRKNISRSTRFKVLTKSRFKCFYCGALAEEKQLHVEHVFAVNDGGENDIWNLVAACRDCNYGKAARSFYPARAESADELEFPPIHPYRPEMQGPSLETILEGVERAHAKAFKNLFLRGREAFIEEATVACSDECEYRDEMESRALAEEENA